MRLHRVHPVFLRHYPFPLSSFLARYRPVLKPTEVAAMRWLNFVSDISKMILHRLCICVMLPLLILSIGWLPRKLTPSRSLARSKEAR